MATIYIVEDDINIREIERYALKNSGYEVEEFEGSTPFFKRLEKNIPSLILLDIMLPGEDGLDILTRIRADKATADVPVIMVTAKTSELDKVKGLDLGADLKAAPAPENETSDEPEPVAAPENEIPDEPKVAKPQKEPETKAEEAAPMDFSDPHKLMTPEEIAALIAKM